MHLRYMYGIKGAVRATPPPPDSTLHIAALPGG